MTNEIANRQSTSPDLFYDDVDDPFLQHSQEAGSRSIVGTMLKFSKGDWFAGQDNDEVPVGTHFVANMFELLHGWVHWEDNKPGEHIMGKVFKRYKLPSRKTLGDLDKEQWDVQDNGDPRDPWQETYYLLMMGTGNAEGELFTFPTSSKGGRDAILELCNDYGRARRSIQDPDTQLPIVEIGTGGYMHPNKSRGRIKTPEFKIVGWANRSLFEDVPTENHDPVTGEVIEPPKTATKETTTAAAKDKIDEAAAAMNNEQPKKKTRF